MHDLNKKRTARAATLIIVLALAGGCSTAGDWIKERMPKRSQERAVIGAPGADEYLRELAMLATGDPATQAEIYADAEAGAKLTPGPTTDLRFALVLATPGHAESNATRAQSLLRELIAKAELLTADELALAQLHLNTVERLIVVDNETRRLRESSSRAARTEEQAVSRRLASVEAENRRLRGELEEAEEKLEAITSIERSIRQQE